MMGLKVVIFVKICGLLLDHYMHMLYIMRYRLKKSPLVSLVDISLYKLNIYKWSGIRKYSANFYEELDDYNGPNGLSYYYYTGMYDML